MELQIADFSLSEELSLALQRPADCYAKSAQLLTNSNLEADQARLLRDWARYELAHGDHEKGQALWQEAREIFTRLNMPLELARMDEEER